MTRRQAIKTSALASVALTALSGANAQDLISDLISTTPESFTLPPLPYAYDALEPHIDARTMEIHHDKHHAAYVANLNKTVADYPDLGKKSIEDLMKDLNDVPEKIRTAVRNNGGGHYNHSLFWLMMKPNGGGEPTGDLAKAIDTNFGSFDAFKDKFTEASTKVFGSGWTWLVADGAKLKIVSTPNQDTPLSIGQIPLLGLDIWEHAYYLKHKNKRADYIAAWWNVVNWDFVSERHAKL
jgi:Fe-Mn family superoxide dismutase